MMRHWLPSTAFLAVFLGGISASADEAETSNAEATQLIEQLDAPRFADRQTAQQELAELGRAALPALEAAAASENREVAGRAMDVLERHFRGEDEGLKAAAKESLDRLAIHQSQSVARRAKEIVSPPEPEPPRRIPNIPNLRIGGARIQIQVQNAGPNFRRVSVKNVNGVKEIEAEENGRKVKVVDDPAKGIQVEITETKNGKERTEKYQAKNADELKTKHPEAHQLYEEYANGNGARVQVGGLPAVPGARPAAPVRRRLKILRPDEVEAARKSVQEALESLDASLETLRKESEQNAAIKGAIEKAESAKGRLEELRQKLES